MHPIIASMIGSVITVSVRQCGRPSVPQKRHRRPQAMSSTFWSRNSRVRRTADALNIASMLPVIEIVAGIMLQCGMYNAYTRLALREIADDPQDRNWCDEPPYGR